MKVLINAYACRPNSGSEAGMAWNWIVGLVGYQVEAFVITEGEWRDEIQATLPQIPNHDLIHFYYCPVTNKIREMCWNQGDYRFYYYYSKWQKRVLGIAENIVARHKIDIVHQLNMIGFREPGYLWRIKGIPYVWGPIGGMNIVPLQYLAKSPFKVRLKYFFKNEVTKIQYKYHPRVLKAIERSSVLITANRFSYDVLMKRHPEKSIVKINEAGCTINIGPAAKSFKCSEFNILWVGRFIPTKLMELTLDVISALKDLHGLKLHVIGKAFSDEETQRYHQMANDKGVGGLCQWHSWVSHDEVQVMMQQSDIFFFPSVVEGTPHVVLEAIANHLPVVCFNTCGQADAVDDTVGIKIPLGKPEESVRLFANTLRDLYHDRQLLAKLSDGCAERKKILSWNRKIEELMTIYKEITAPKVSV